MPCHFNSTWLDKKDVNGYNVRDWGQKFNDGRMLCMLCQKDFSIKKGFCYINQHASNDKHKKQCLEKLSANQLKLCIERPSINTSKQVAEETSINSKSNPAITLKLYDVKDSAITAELIWILKMVQSNYSFNSCSDSGDIFRAMFPTPGAVPENFTLGRTKSSYLLTDALSPYFKDLLVKDCSGSYYTILFDETTNSASRKELDIGIRYWSDNKQRVMTQHLQTYFIGSATAEDLVSKLDDSLLNAGLSKHNLIMLGSDGPNVNKAVFNQINEELITSRRTPLLDLGTCNIHITHNAYLKGLSKFGEQTSNFVFAVHHYFDGWPARWDDFQEILKQKNLPLLHFLKHVPSRWLTLEPAAERALMLLPALEEYFFKFLQKNKSNLIKQSSTQKMILLLKDTTLRAQLHFIISSARLFTKFTRLFQRDEPLVHLLYSELEDVAKVIMGRICKTDILKEKGVCEMMLNNENLLPLLKIHLGDAINEELKKISERDALIFRAQAQKHYKAACLHILKKSSLKNKAAVKHLRVLNPNRRSDKGSDASIVYLAKSLPIDIKMDVLRDEWLLLQADAGMPKDAPIEKYWATIFSAKTEGGESKYPNVSVVVKACLSLSHGNAFVEREFSQSARTLTEARASMSERTLDAVMTVKGALQLYENKPHLVPITRELKTLAKCAYGKYSQYLEEQRKMKEAENKSRKEKEANEAIEKENREKLKADRKMLDEDEQNLIRLQKEEKQKKIADKLYQEASNRLREAKKTNSEVELNMATHMFESVDAAKKEADKKSYEVQKLQSILGKRKNKVIETLSDNKRRKK